MAQNEILATPPTKATPDKMDIENGFGEQEEVVFPKNKNMAFYKINEKKVVYRRNKFE